MENLEIDFQQICRACKSENKKMQSIFEPLKLFETILEQNVADILVECTSIQISPNDGLPEKICCMCINQLQDVFKFKRKCQKTDFELRLYRQNELVKQEIEISNVQLFENDVPENYKKDNICNLKFEMKNTTNVEELLVPLKCEVCDEQFNIKTDLEKHLKKHKPKKVFVCKICNKQLSHLEKAKRHMIVHLKTKPYSCKKCNRGFNKTDNLRTHEQRCNGENTHVCEICNRGFNRPDALFAHVAIHDNDSDLKPMLENLDNIDEYIKIEELFDDLKIKNCDQNNLIEKDGMFDEKFDGLLDPKCIGFNDTTSTPEPSFQTLLMNEKSKKTKKGSKLKMSPPFVCRLCGSKFNRPSHLKRHCLTHGDYKPFPCFHCGKTFARRDHLIRHSQLHSTIKEFKCDLCPREFSKKEQLEKHKAIKHDIGEKIKSLKIYKCSQCLKSFTTDKYREIHEKAHHIVREKEIKCKTCNVTFKDKSELLEHEKVSVECVKKYLCSECGQRFMRKNYLVVHMRRHRGERPYKCRFCGKGFPRSTDVTRHEKYHTGEKNHLCIICGKGFGRAYNLTLHMRTHTGEKPYACTYCDSRFTQSNDLRAHTRRHTGERYYCDICGDPFLMGYLLKQHKKTVHGIEYQSQRIQSSVKKSFNKIKMDDEGEDTDLSSNSLENSKENNETQN